MLEQKTNDLEALLQKTMCNSIRNSETKKESWENIKKSLLENLQRTGLLLEEIERNIDKLHWVGRFDHETQTQLPIIVKFKTLAVASKEKFYHQQKKLAKGIKIPPSLTKWQSDILQQVQHIIKEESSDDSLN